MHQHEHGEHNIDLPGGGLGQQLPLGGERAQETPGELLVKDVEEEEPLSGTRQKRNLYSEQTSQ